MQSSRYCYRFDQSSKFFAVRAANVLQVTVASAPGSYLTISVGGDCGSANRPPAVSAGPDQSITLPASAALSGTANDDGLPPGATLTTTWSQVSGPGTVTFGNASALTTSVSFSAAGTYVLRLTVSDSVLSKADDVQITVKAPKR